MSTEYIDKATASKLSGRSVRRLLELAATGKIRKVFSPDPRTGKGRIAVFNRADVVKLGQPTVPVLVPVKRVKALPPPEEPQPAPPVQTPRLWMTLDEAAAYSGLPRTFLERIVGEGKLPALDVGVRPGGRWRVAKLALDAFGAPASYNGRSR